MPMPALSAKRRTVSTIQAWVGSREFDDLRAGAGLGDELAHQQRDRRAAEANHQREGHQPTDVQPVGVQPAVQAQQVDDDAQHDHDGQVGHDEEQDSFHREPSG